MVNVTNSQTHKPSKTFKPSKKVNITNRVQSSDEVVTLTSAASVRRFFQEIRQAN